MSGSSSSKNNDEINDAFAKIGLSVENVLRADEKAQITSNHADEMAAKDAAHATVLEEKNKEINDWKKKAEVGATELKKKEDAHADALKEQNAIIKDLTGQVTTEKEASDANIRALEEDIVNFNAKSPNDEDKRNEYRKALLIGIAARTLTKQNVEGGIGEQQTDPENIGQVEQESPNDEDERNEYRKKLLIRIKARTLAEQSAEGGTGEQQTDSENTGQVEQESPNDEDERNEYRKKLLIRIKARTLAEQSAEGGTGEQQTDSENTGQVEQESPNDEDERKD